MNNSESAQTGATSEPVERAHHGMLGLFEDALGEASLRPEQQAVVDQLTQEFKARHEPVKAAKHNFLRALADQIEKGTIDRCALAPQIAEVAAQKERVQAADRAAFEKLHATLSPDQRVQFVNALRRRYHERMEKRDSGKWIDEAGDALSLTADQKTSLHVIANSLKEIRDVEPGYIAHKEAWHKLLDAFKTDHFVLDEVAPAGDMAARSKARASCMLSAVEFALPILTPEQRTLAAHKIREKVSAKEHEPTGQTQQSDIEMGEMGD